MIPNPKTCWPDDYDSKSPLMGCQFLRHCENYARVSPFENEEIQIQWEELSDGVMNRFRQLHKFCPQLTLSHGQPSE
jgi:hypothetical protein